MAEGAAHRLLPRPNRQGAEEGEGRGQEGPSCLLARGAEQAERQHCSLGAEAGRVVPDCLSSLSPAKEGAWPCRPTNWYGTAGPVAPWVEEAEVGLEELLTAGQAEEGEPTGREERGVDRAKRARRSDGAGRAGLGQVWREAGAVGAARRELSGRAELGGLGRAEGAEGQEERQGSSGRARMVGEEAQAVCGRVSLVAPRMQL